jgi:carboxyl-terminal processing protease
MDNKEHRNPPGYQGQLVILADHATWSAWEDFIMPFKDNGRAILIGETTGGSTGQPYGHTFENEMAFGVGTKRVYMPDGTPFEGIGHAPDVPVERRREDLITGRDPVLEKAIAIIKE